MGQKVASPRKAVMLILVSVLSLTICLGALEIATRLYASVFTDYDLEMYRYARELKVPVVDARHHVHQPDKTLKLMSVDIMIDSEGRRACPEAESDDMGLENSAVFLGDSVALGWGVSADETFVCQIGKSLGYQRFINAGVGNYNIEAIATQFEHEFESLFPDLVIYSFYTNDIELEANERNLPGVLQESYFLAWMRAISHRLTWAFSGRSYEQHYQALYQTNQSQFWSRLEDLKYVAESRGARFIVMILPDLNIAGNSATGHFLSGIEDGLRQRSVETIPVYRLESWDGQKGWVSVQDSHPNPAIHKKIFEVFCKQYPDLCLKK